jgi:uncharacterized membrane protein
MELGQTEYTVRSLSAILGIVAICLTYALGARLVNRRFAAIAATLLATSPFLIWYSQETRYVTLAITTGLFSMYSFQRALSTDSLEAWLLYIIATMLALFAFVPNAFVVMGQGIYVVCSKNRSQILRWITYQIPVVVAFGSWLIITYGGLSIANIAGPVNEPHGFHVPSLNTGTPRKLSAAVIPYTFFAFTSGFSIGPSIEELHISRDPAALIEHLPSLVPLGLIFGTLFLIGLIQLYRQTHKPSFLLLWLVTPILAVLLVSATTSVAYNVRYVCAALPAYILILAAGITGLRKPAVQIGVLLVVLLANGLSLAQYYFNPRYAKADAREAARFLEAGGDSQDVILLVGSSTALRHYYKGHLRVVSWSRSDNSNRERVSKNVHELARRYDRVWFIAIRPWETDPKGNVKAVLDQSFENIKKMKLPGVAISSYVPKNSQSASPNEYQ